MAPQPSSSFSTFLALLAALPWVACAGTSAPERSAPAEATPPASGRSLLDATTPEAAAARRDAEARDPAADALPPSDDPAADTRPGRLLIYSAITGHVPLEEKPAYDPGDQYRSPAEREAARARSIEAEIEEELEKQEDLGGGSDKPSGPDAGAASRPANAPVEPGADPLEAPPAPTLRRVPPTLFDSKEMTIPAGRWQNRYDLRVVQRSLDVNDDGRPEEIRYEDADTGLLLRTEHDRDFDGKLDAWVTYQDGEPVIQVIDRNGDGKPDAWERYEDGRVAARTLDEDGDGVKDTFYRYEGDSLIEKIRDANDDGTMDLVESYHERRRTRTEEDRSLNGAMDTWTTWQVVGGREVVASVQRDTRDSGKPDVFETYETQDGETRLVRKEEDVDGDGKIDIISTYENGKLVQRAISDEALSPL